MNTPQNLGELNALLSQANIPQLTNGQFRALRESRPRQQLLAAASRVVNDDGARKYLVNAIQEIGVSVPVGNNESAAQPQPTQPQSPQPRPAYPSSARTDQAPLPAPQGDPRDEPPMQEQGGRGGSSSDRFNYNMHIYGGKAALCFEPADTRGGDYTVSLDSATATQPRSYDWSNKLRLQMTRNELPVVAGVLLGLIPKCEYKNHGPNNDKGFSLEDQGRKIFIRTWAKDHPARAVPVEPEDAYRVATLILRQMGLNAPWMGPSDIIQTIRMVVARRMAAE